MIHLDTSVLIDAFTAEKRLAAPMRELLGRGERIAMSALVLFEWRRGPRIPEETEAQEALFPASDAIPFGPAEALEAAEAYARVKRPRGREIDLAIAACAIAHHASLWTVNTADFEDIPRLKLLRL
jgi:predicted nucleic acid-binding protein